MIVAAVALLASSAAQAELVEIVNDLRSAGCGTRPPVAMPERRRRRRIPV
jgi:hypothetical protein